MALLSVALLLACPGPPDNSSDQTARPASPSPVARETIRDWSLSAPGEWRLSAALAERKGQLWMMDQLAWRSPRSAIALDSAKAQETAPRRFVLRPLTLKAPGLQAEAPQAELDLTRKRLSGGAVSLTGRGWSLKAAGFEAGFPLRQWRLQKVSARFTRP